MATQNHFCAGCQASITIADTSTICSHEPKDNIYHATMDYPAGLGFPPSQWVWFVSKPSRDLESRIYSMFVEICRMDHDAAHVFLHKVEEWLSGKSGGSIEVGMDRTPANYARSFYNSGPSNAPAEKPYLVRVDFFKARNPAVYQVLGDDDAHPVALVTASCDGPMRGDWRQPLDWSTVHSRQVYDFFPSRREANLAMMKMVGRVFDQERQVLVTIHGPTNIEGAGSWELTKENPPKKWHFYLMFLA